MHPKGSEGRMTEQGYIKLHRSILGWEWWGDANTTRVFLWLLLNAQWEDSRYRGVEIPKGSLIAGRKIIAEEFGISERNVRTSLNHLKSTNEITIKSTNKFSVITIVNWEKYQGFDSEVTNKLTNKPSLSRPTSDHIKEIKNIRNKEEKKSGTELYHNYKHSNYDFAALERELKNG